MIEKFPNPSRVISSDEYRQRWTKVQGMMAELDLDFLIAYADDRATFGPAHARWLADFPVHFEPVCILLSREGDPIMLTGPESVEYALLRGRISDVRALREFTHPDEDYPFSTIQGLGEIMAETGTDLSSVRRIGLGGRGLMPGDVLSAFRAVAPQAEWLDVENALCDLRAQKSPAEVEVIRYAYRIAEIGLQAGIDAIRPGVTEREVKAEIECAIRRAGAEGTGIDTIVASGLNTRPILARSTFRQIQPNDLVLLTVAPRYEGYHAAIGRPVLVGNPAPEIVRSLEIAVTAQTQAAIALRPGIEGREVEAIGRRIVEEAGLGQYFLYSGVHSVGVIEFEPPIFGPSSPAMLKENMIISIDIPLFDAPWGGLRIEDGYLITAVGAEKLNETPFILRKG
jgi:Xaa-Pro aminopeptidase